MKTAIIGGGAAGFFLAINLKEMMPTMEVTIFEKSKKVLAKVEVSGGGRCNCTNSFEAVRDLSQVYPRGHRLMKRLFKTFDYHDAYAWFENHGVRLVTQDCFRLPRIHIRSSTFSSPKPDAMGSTSAPKPKSSPLIN